jgi:hypothetical protein
LTLVLQPVVDPLVSPPFLFLLLFVARKLGLGSAVAAAAVSVRHHQAVLRLRDVPLRLAGAARVLVVRVDAAALLVDNRVALALAVGLVGVDARLVLGDRGAGEVTNPPLSTTPATRSREEPWPVTSGRPPF